MNLPENCELAYIIGAETWWHGRAPAEEPPYVSVQAADRDGQGVAWEFRVVQLRLTGKTLHLRIFADAFGAFEQVPELFAALAELDRDRTGNDRHGFRRRQPTLLSDLIAILDSLGAIDRTPRHRPEQPSTTPRSDFQRGWSEGAMWKAQQFLDGSAPELRERGVERGR